MIPLISEIPQELSVEDCKDFLTKFEYLFQQYYDTHLLEDMKNMYHTIHSYHNNKAAPLFYSSNQSQLLVNTGESVFGSYFRLFLQQKLSEINFYLFERRLESLYLSHLSPILPNSSQELNLLYFNIFYISRFFAVNNSKGVQRKNKFQKIKDFNEFLQEKIKLLPVTNMVTQKNLVVIVRSPEDLLNLELGADLQAYLNLFNQKKKKKNSPENATTEDESEEAKEEPVLFGKYEIIHGEYSSSSTGPSNLPSLFTQKSQGFLQRKRENIHFDEDFYVFVQLAMSYSAMTLDANLSERSEPIHRVIDIISTDWIGGKNFEIYFSHEGFEMVIRHTNLLSSQIQNIPSIPNFIHWKQDQNYDLLNKMESSLSTNVKIRFLPDRVDSICLGLQKKVDGTTAYSEFPVTDVIFKLSPPLSSEGKQEENNNDHKESIVDKTNPVIVLEGPNVIFVDTNEIHIQARVKGNGIVYCSLYELPLGMNYQTFTTLADNYRNKLNRVQSSQIRQFSTRNELKLSFCFPKLVANCIYGIVLDTEESLLFSSVAKTISTSSISSSASPLSKRILPFTAITKTLPLMRHETKNYLSTFFFSGLTTNDFKNDSYRNMKLSYLNQHIYRISTNQFIGLFYSRGVIEEQRFSEEILFTPAATQKPRNSKISTAPVQNKPVADKSKQIIYEEINYQPIIVNNFQEINKLFDVKFQEPPIAPSLFLKGNNYNLQQLEMNYLSRTINNPLQQSTIAQTEVIAPTATPSSAPASSSSPSAFTSFSVKIDNKFCYLILKQQNDLALLEMIHYIESNLLVEKSSSSSRGDQDDAVSVLVISNSRFLVDILYHDYNSNEWLKENYLKSTKLIIIKLFQILLKFKMFDAENEVLLLSVGLVPEITAMMINYYSEGGVFYGAAASPARNGGVAGLGAGLGGDDNQSLNTFFTTQHIQPDYSSSAGNSVSKVVETSVFNRKNSIYLYVFPLYQYNPLAIRSDSDDEEEEEEEEIIITGTATKNTTTQNQNQNKNENNVSEAILGKEKFLRFPTSEVRITSTIMCKVLSSLEMKKNENVMIYKPLVRFYAKAQSLKLKEPVTFQINLFFHSTKEESSKADELQQQSSSLVYEESSTVTETIVDPSNPSHSLYQPSQSLTIGAGTEEQSINQMSVLRSEDNNSDRKTHLKVIIHTILDDVDFFQVTFGPVIGRITSSEARVMFEFNMDVKEIECVLVPTNIQVVNNAGEGGEATEESAPPADTRIVCKKSGISQYSPVTFTFHDLQPDTRYNVTIPSLFPNKIFTTLKTNPLIVLQTEVMFVAKHHYENLSIQKEFLHQIENHQFPNLSQLILLMNLLHRDLGNSIISYEEKNQDIPNIFDLINNNLIKTNQLENILVIFHLDSLTFFTHFYDQIKCKVFSLVKKFLLFESKRKLQLQEELTKEEKRNLLLKENRKNYRKMIKEGKIQINEYDNIEDVIKELEKKEDLDFDIKLFDEKFDQMLSDSYLQQIIEIMNDTIRILWSHPDVAQVLSRCCHIPLYHSEYILPVTAPYDDSSSSPMSPAKRAKKENERIYFDEEEIPDPTVENFIRNLFERQIQLYILELYGMDEYSTPEKKNKVELKYWRLGPLLILVLDIVNCRTKIKGADKLKNQLFGSPLNEGDDEEKDDDDNEDEEKKEDGKTKNDEEGGGGGEEEDQDGGADGEDEEQEKSKKKKKKKKSKNAEEGEEGQEAADPEPAEEKLSSSKKQVSMSEEKQENNDADKKPPLFSYGFIEKNQWKLIRKLCVDDKLTQLIIAIEKPLIPLTSLPVEFDLTSFELNIERGNIIPFQPILSDLEIFFNYWIDWIGKIRNASNGIESRSVLFVSKDDVSYSTVIQDLKTGIKLHQVCVGNYDVKVGNEDDPPKEINSQGSFSLTFFPPHFNLISVDFSSRFCDDREDWHDEIYAQPQEPRLRANDFLRDRKQSTIQKEIEAIRR